MQPPGYLPWATQLRGLAIYQVVLLHAAAPLVGELSPEDPRGWWFGNVYDSAMRSCIPLFLMLSGALILHRDEPLREFFFKRLLRICVPLAFWIVLYLIFNTWYYENSWAATVLVSKALTGRAAFHLWFLYLLVAIYLAFPLLGPWARNARRTHIEFVLALWFVLWSALPLTMWAVGSGTFHPALHHIGYGGFVILGYYLTHRSRLWLSAPSLVWVAVFLAAFATTVLGTFVASAANEGALDEVFYNYDSPTVVLMAISCFLLFKGSDLGSSPVLQRSLSLLGRYSFGIYLVHMIPLTLLKSGLLGITLNEGTPDASVGPLLTGTVVLGLSLALVAASHTIWFLRPLAAYVLPVPGFRRNHP